jgi:hypothetical protein
MKNTIYHVCHYKAVDNGHHEAFFKALQNEASNPNGCITNLKIYVDGSLDEFCRTNMSIDNLRFSFEQQVTDLDLERKPYEESKLKEDIINKLWKVFEIFNEYCLEEDADDDEERDERDDYYDRVVTGVWSCNTGDFWEYRICDDILMKVQDYRLKSYPKGTRILKEDTKYKKISQVICNKENFYQLIDLS